jgi:hypothetical protein
MCLDLLPIRIGRIRIAMPLIPIPDKIRQNFAEPTQPGTDPQYWKIPKYLDFCRFQTS